MKPPRGFASVGLLQPKFSINVGHALRACGVFDAAMLAYTGRRFDGAPTDTMDAYKRLPLIRAGDLFDVVPHGAVPVAVDIIDGARDLATYQHPPRAFYIFGPEDGTLGPTITDRCRDVVCVETRGCMNLAAAVNVVLYDRQAKWKREHRLREGQQCP